jgi:hypothetical protein
VEGGGSFQINNRLQVVFEVGQMYDHMAVYGISKMFEMPAKVKDREGDTYLRLSTKNRRVLDSIMRTLKGKMLGIKSFEYRL